jgi:hypothetical protein
MDMHQKGAVSSVPNIVIIAPRPNDTIRMQRLQAFEYELMPNGEQQRDMRRFAGACRSADNRRTQNGFKCVECGFNENADVVGAINVLRAGHARLACEVSGAVMPPAAGTQRSDLSRRNVAISAVGILRL